MSSNRTASPHRHLQMSGMSRQVPRKPECLPRAGQKTFSASLIPRVISRQGCASNAGAAMAGFPTPCSASPCGFSSRSLCAYASTSVELRRRTSLSPNAAKVIQFGKTHLNLVEVRSVKASKTLDIEPVRQSTINLFEQIDRISSYGFGERAKLDEVNSSDPRFNDGDMGLLSANPLSQFGLGKPRFLPGGRQDFDEGPVGRRELRSRHGASHDKETLELYPIFRYPIFRYRKIGCFGQPRADRVIPGQRIIMQFFQCPNTAPQAQEETAKRCLISTKRSCPNPLGQYRDEHRQHNCNPEKAANA